MRLFSRLYERLIAWSGHPHAPYYLCAVSFAESSFFPLPPDIMLVSMSLAHPQKAWRWAVLTTCASVLGGIFGYVIGYYAFHSIEAYLQFMGYMPSYELVKQWFDVWGFPVVLLAGFTPIPYKLFTVTAGSLQMALLPFIFASILGRGLRFFLVAASMYWGGERLHVFLQAQMDRVIWVLLAVLVLIGLYYHYHTAIWG